MARHRLALLPCLRGRLQAGSSKTSLASRLLQRASSCCSCRKCGVHCAATFHATSGLALPGKGEHGTSHNSFHSALLPCIPQEVLRALHSHLGAHVPAEVDAALEVLAKLAKAHNAGLMRYAAFLTNILDYLDGYSVSQTHQVGWLNSRVAFGQLVWFGIRRFALSIL